MITSKNIESEIAKLSDLANENNYHFRLDLLGSSCNGDPEMYIKINNQIHYDGKFNGSRSFIIDCVLPDDIDCDIILGMRNKNDSNTIVDGDKILQDQNVRILDITINNLSIVKNNLYFWDESKFVKNPSNEILNKINGLYFNGEFVLRLKTPIFPYLVEKFRSKTSNQFQNYTISMQQRQELINTVFD
jgi:hypothetical protein